MLPRAGAGQSLTALAEALNAPVITSNKARGVIPEDHPLSVGIPSMAGVAAIARGADVCNSAMDGAASKAREECRLIADGAERPR